MLSVPAATTEVRTCRGRLAWQSLALAARLAVGAALVASAFMHIINPYRYLDSILAYRLLPAWLAGLAAAGLPALQLVLGGAVLAVRPYRRTALIFSALLFALYLAAQLSAWHRGLEITCGCFGSESAPIGWKTISFVAGCMVLSLAALPGAPRWCRESRQAFMPVESSSLELDGPPFGCQHSGSVGPRRGFTLVELLVVLAIVVVLSALLAAGVQKVRSSAARADCQNRMRQVGTALHQYHGANRVLPPGLTVMLENRKRAWLGWPARMLPYLEQDALWGQIEQAYATDPMPFSDNPIDFHAHPPHNAILATPVTVFNCPADWRLPGPHRVNDSEIVAAFTSYLGVQGLNPYRKDGVLFRDSQIAFAHIADGLSSTLMLGERPPSYNFRFGWWYRGWGQERDGSAEMLLGVRERNRSEYHCRERGPFPFQPSRLSDPCSAFHFWSLHPGGAHFAFADGSVRFLQYSANDLLPALASRAGGEPVEIP